MPFQLQYKEVSENKVTKFFMPRTSFGIRCLQSVVTDGTHQTPPTSPLTQMSHRGTNACITQSKIFSVKCVEPGGDCLFTLPTVTNRLPDGWFIRCIITWKSLGHILPAEVVTGYGAKAGSLGAALPNVPIIRPVISILDSLKKCWPGKRTFKNDWRITKCHFLAAW